MLTTNKSITFNQIGYNDCICQFSFCSHFPILFCIVKCPTAAQTDVILEAIRKGDISWHAGPMNLEIEMAEPWLFEFSLDLSMQLDKMFNITRSSQVLSQRDVPG